jgi:hypothetical protein
MILAEKAAASAVARVVIGLVLRHLDYFRRECVSHGAHFVDSWFFRRTF